MIYIYKIINKIDGKIYIGQTKNVKERWKRHKWDAGNINKCKSYFHKAISAHGSENFIIETILEISTRDEANIAEIKLIKELKSNDKNFGYNLTTGGEGFNGIYGVNHHRFGKTAHKLTEFNKSRIGIKLTTEHKSKINPNGRKHSDETRIKMSEARKNAWKSGKYEDTNWMRFTETAD